MGKEIKRGVPFWVCLVAMIVTGVASFIVPPTGVIDESVLKFIAFLFATATISQIPIIIQVAGHLRMTKGDVTIEASSTNTEIK